jgi:hypothetical protein
MNKKVLGGALGIVLSAGLLAAHGWGATQVPLQTPGPRCSPKANI